MDDFKKYSGWITAFVAIVMLGFKIGVDWKDDQIYKEKLDCTISKIDTLIAHDREYQIFIKTNNENSNKTISLIDDLYNRVLAGSSEEESDQ